MNFSALGLDSDIVDRLTRQGIENATPIQEECFPKIFGGAPVLGLSKTGTGKTFAYLLPLVQKAKSYESGAIHFCILVPTRELATQVARDVRFLSGSEEACVVVVGGESEEKQISGAKNAQWLVATPGRLLDLLKRKVIDLKSLKTLVFDEADRLLDMGFVDDMREIRRFVPDQVQLLFFSATLHFGIDEMAYEFGAGAETLQQVGVSGDELTVEGLDHRVAFVGDDEKFHALVNFLQERPDKAGIVFSNYRDKAGMIATRLKGLGCRAETLTAQLNQSQRTKIMEMFRAQKIQVLIASDLAARGLDVFHLDFVINFDLPEDPATYVHRVGRTARAGREGIAISFVGFEDSFRLERLEKYLKKKIDRHEIPTEMMSGRLKRFAGSENDAPVDIGEDGEVRPHQAERNDRGNRHGQNDRGRPSRNQERNQRPAQGDRNANQSGRNANQSGRNANQERPPATASPQAQAPANVQTPRAQQPAANLPAVRAKAQPGFFARIMIAIKSLFGIKGAPAAPAQNSGHRPAQGQNPSRHGNSGQGGGGGNRNRYQGRNRNEGRNDNRPRRPDDNRGARASGDGQPNAGQQSGRGPVGGSSRSGGSGRGGRPRSGGRPPRGSGS